MTDDEFEKLTRIAKNEFGVSIVRTDDSETSQMLLDELKVELKALDGDIFDKRRTVMTMLEAKAEIENAIFNNCPTSLDAMLIAYLAINTYISLYGSHDIAFRVNIDDIRKENKDDVSVDF